MLSLLNPISKSANQDIVTLTGTGGEIRTPIGGFGDHNSAIELRPYLRYT
jgi:hypothetical protein